MAPSITLDARIVEPIQVQDVTVLTVHCRSLNARTSRSILRSVATHAASRRLVLDMGQVALVDRDGVAALLHARRCVQAVSGELKLCDLRSDVRRLFECMQLHRTLAIYNTLDHAIAYFQM